MTVTAQLKSEHSALWSAAIGHRFIVELGDGTLSRERFARYFVQDYIFINDLVKMAGIAVAKAPDARSARPIEGFLNAILGAEDALFVDAFKTLGVPEAEYSGAEALPTTAAFGNFLVRLAYEGSFREICAAMLVTEGVYLAWGDRLRTNGADPAAGGSELGRFYQGWIDLHTDDALGPIVRHLTSIVDQAKPAEMPKLGTIFERALGYEVAFWDMAYEGENWP
ncbi:MAG: TenA family protein [Chloroflexi bacterium]|nr:TenA family protein [Chloroflexota bacterium]